MASDEIEGENAKGNADHSAVVIKNTMGLDGPFRTPFQRDSSAKCSLMRAAEEFRMWGHKGERKVKSKDFSEHNNQVERYNHGICKLPQNCCVRNGTLVVNEQSAGDLQLSPRPPKATDEFLTVELFSF